MEKNKMEQCKKIVYSGPRPQGLISRRCKRRSVRDGYCKQHHPEEVKKREEHRARVLDNTPFSMIHRY